MNYQLLWQVQTFMIIIVEFIENLNLFIRLSHQFLEIKANNRLFYFVASEASSSSTYTDKSSSKLKGTISKYLCGVHSMEQRD